MPHPDAPPTAAGADKLVDDMLSFLRGGRVPEPAGADPHHDRTGTWAAGASTVDPADWTPGPAARDTTPDREYGPYRVIRWVAKGGMGDVFHARHRDIPREAAVKTIRPEFNARSGMRERFRLEAAAAASLDHPNVIKLFDFDEQAGELYIAMEWAPGGTLSARLDDRPMPAREAAALVRTLAEAMAYAHGRGVLHRDLKPGNVLLAADGTPKVADFGLARFLSDDEDDAGRLTQTGVVMGTPAYMAPEQASGRDVDARTDVYALGVILFEALTGAPPFSGNTKDAVLKQVRESDPPRPSSVTPGLHPDLEAVCLRCLSKDARTRYTTATELATDLGRYLAGEPTVARPPTLLRRAARAVRKRWRVLAQVAVVAAFAGTLAAMLPRPPGSIPVPPDPREALAAELAAGREVVLLGANGPAPYGTRVRYNANKTSSGVSHDGVFSVSSGGMGFVELVPRPAPTRYRLRAEVRHARTESGGKVGLYVAERTSPGHAGVENGWMACLGYDDWETIDDFEPKSHIPVIRPASAPPRPNSAILSINTHGLMPNGHPWEEFGSAARGHGIPYFPQSGAAPWTLIEFDVSPAWVRARWRDHPAGELTAAIVRATITDWKNTGPGRAGAGPCWELLDPTLDPTGGVGLSVNYGTAEYRNVVLTPLPHDTP